MDLSQDYIKMCEKAEEIQSLRAGKEEDGDWWYGTYPENCGYPKREQILVVGSSFHSGYIDNDYCSTFTPLVWLPRQDQLQEMVNASIDELWKRVVEFAGYESDEYEWLAPKYRKYSWEQLWLAFVMKEKYGKIWDGTQWDEEV